MFALAQLNLLLTRIDEALTASSYGAGGQNAMWWALAISGWTLLSFIASPLIGNALAGGHALKIREGRRFEASGQPIPGPQSLA